MLESPCLTSHCGAAGFRDRVEKPMMERDPRLCSGLIWKELFLQPEELNGAASQLHQVLPSPAPDPGSN